MELDNAKRIKLYKDLYKIFSTNNIIKVELPDNYIDGLVLIREKKLAVIDTINKNDFVLPFWDNYNGSTILSFPTPPFEKHMSMKDEKLSRFIVDTRNIIDDMMKNAKPKKLILDLRSNLGGFIHVFYDALYPILPKHDGVILSGVDLDGNVLMTLSEENMNLKLSINDPMNGKMMSITKLTPCEKLNIPEIEIFVNSRSASSSEMIMIMFSQLGYKVTGGPTMGLTSGMLTQEYKNYSVSIPSYWFKDKNGKVYRASLRKKDTDTGVTDAKLLMNNVVSEIPKSLLSKINSSTPPSTINHIHCQFLNENAHFSINYPEKNPPIIHVNIQSCLYIYVPTDCVETIRSVLDKYQIDVLSSKLVIIDIRNAKIKGLDGLKIFDGLYKPFTVPLKETNNKVDEKGSFYVSDGDPYITLTRRCTSGKYANINAKIWVNKSSIYCDTYSTVLLRYLTWSFGLVEGSKKNYFFDFSLFKFTKPPFYIELYTCKY
jgi:hypothetical protein